MCLAVWQPQEYSGCFSPVTSNDPVQPASCQSPFPVRFPSKGEEELLGGGKVMYEYPHMIYPMDRHRVTARSPRRSRLGSKRRLSFLIGITIHSLDKVTGSGRNALHHSLPCGDVEGAGRSDRHSSGIPAPFARSWLRCAGSRCDPCGTSAAIRAPSPESPVVRSP